MACLFLPFCINTCFLYLCAAVHTATVIFMIASHWCTRCSVLPCEFRIWSDKIFFFHTWTLGLKWETNSGTLCCVSYSHPSTSLIHPPNLFDTKFCECITMSQYFHHTGHIYALEQFTVAVFFWEGQSHIFHTEHICSALIFVCGLSEYGLKQKWHNSSMNATSMLSSGVVRWK